MRIEAAYTPRGTRRIAPDLALLLPGPSLTGPWLPGLRPTVVIRHAASFRLRQEVGVGSPGRMRGVMVRGGRRSPARGAWIASPHSGFAMTGRDLGFAMTGRDLGACADRGGVYAAPHQAHRPRPCFAVAEAIAHSFVDAWIATDGRYPTTRPAPRLRQEVGVGSAGRMRGVMVRGGRRSPARGAWIASPHSGFAMTGRVGVRDDGERFGVRYDGESRGSS